jgi:tetratricopeptide (TPR) repeat protein
MFADMVGYTALMQEDERRAKLLRDRQREVLEKRVAEFEGEIIQYYGDGALSGFQSAIQAVKCAVAIQVDLREGPRVPVRIGIHLGDVAFDKTGVYGDGVNVASRIESLSVPGGVLVSEKVADEVKNQPGIATEFLAEVGLKNVKEPQRVFAVTNEDLVVPGPKEVRGWKKAGGRGAGRGGGWVKWVAIVAAAAVVAVAYVVLSSTETPQQESTSTPLAQERIAILPFDYEGPEDWEYLGPGMAIQLGGPLTSGVFIPIAQTQVGSLFDELRGEGLAGGALLQEVATRSGADFVLHGHLSGRPGGALAVSAYLYDVGLAEDTESAFYDGTVDEFGDLIRRVAGEFLRTRSGSDEGLLEDLPIENNEALKAWVTGDNHFRAGDYPEAVASLQEAVEADSGVAIAHYRLSQAALWGWRWELARGAADDAWGFSSELSPLNRSLLGAWRSFLDSRPAEAEAAYRALLRDHDRNVEVLAGLISVLVYFNALQGRTLEEVEHLVQRALEADPDYGEVRYHAMEFAVRRDDRDGFERWYSGLNPESQQALPFEVLRAVRWGSVAEQDEAVGRLQRANELQTVYAAGRIAAFLHDFPSADRIGSLLQERGPDYRGASPALSASLAFAQGKWNQAKLDLGLTAEIEPEWAREMKALLSLFLSMRPFEVVDQEELRALRDTVEALVPEAGVVPSFLELFGPHARHHQEFRLLLLGLLSVRLGDHEGALQRSRQLREYGYASETQDLTYALSQSVNAHRAFAEGAADQANSILEGMNYYPPFEFISVSPFFSRALDRWLRGEVLMELDRPAEALDWFNTLSDGWGEFLFAGPAHLRQAQIYEYLPDTALAVEHYSEFIRLWGEADSELQPLVESARSARDALTGERGVSQDPPR